MCIRDSHTLLSQRGTIFFSSLGKVTSPCLRYKIYALNLTISTSSIWSPFIYLSYIVSCFRFVFESLFRLYFLTYSLYKVFQSFICYLLFFRCCCIHSAHYKCLHLQYYLNSFTPRKNFRLGKMCFVSICGSHNTCLIPYNKIGAVCLSFLAAQT